MMQINHRIKTAVASALFITAAAGAQPAMARTVFGSLSEPPPQDPDAKPLQDKKPPAPDNSKKNERDRDTRKLTPMDQGSGADVELTRNIRKEITAKKGMSVNGKNIKIITVKSIVTLRGPVATPAEKKLIFDIACRIAGQDKVKDELEVK